jgi:hypothetical protein
MADSLNGKLLTQLRPELDPIRQAIDIHQAKYEQSQSDLNRVLMRVPQNINTRIGQMQEAIESHGEVQVLSQTKLEKAIVTNTAEVKKLQTTVEPLVILLRALRDDDVMAPRAVTSPWQELQEHAMKW